MLWLIFACLIFSLEENVLQMFFNTSYQMYDVLKVSTANTKFRENEWD